MIVALFVVAFISTPLVLVVKNLRSIAEDIHRLADRFDSPQS